MGEESSTSQPPTGAMKQLSAAMEHMRFAVTLPEQDPDTYGIPGFIQPVRKPRTDAANNPEKRSDPFQFGSRFLEEGHDIFEFNAWDHVQTDEAYGKFAEEQYARQRESPVDEAVKSECEINNPHIMENKALLYSIAADYVQRSITTGRNCGGTNSIKTTRPTSSRIANGSFTNFQS
jgi:hypothetical protein